jgi:integral membrane sensor domain MASE1
MTKNLLLTWSLGGLAVTFVAFSIKFYVQTNGAFLARPTLWLFAALYAFVFAVAPGAVLAVYLGVMRLLHKPGNAVILRALVAAYVAAVIYRCFSAAPL